MPPAARIDDTTMHGGTIVEGCDSVLIGRSPAARLGDYHECPMSDPDGQAHVGGPIVTASETVIIGGMPAARPPGIGTSFRQAPSGSTGRGPQPTWWIRWCPHGREGRERRPRRAYRR